MAFYTVAQTAQAAALAPDTVRKYTKGFSDLVRGRDFYIHRRSATRRTLYFTDRGLFRLTTKNYRTYPHGGCSDSSVGIARDSFVELPERYEGTSYGEFNQRLRASVQLILRQYLEGHACAVPACPCMVHRLGLPQADALAKDRAELEARKAARRGGLAPHGGSED